MKPLLKITIALVLVLSAAQLPATPLSVGDHMPDVDFELVGMDEPQSLSSFQGKVVVLEFWATWCSPCIRSMRHLQELQDRFGEQLIVIAVSAEQPERVATFIANTDFPFFYARESAALRAYFPHRVIPHTVLLSPNQQVAAITRPEALTETAIQQLLQGTPINLPRKADRPWDPTIDIFEADSATHRSFQIQPARPEAPTYSRVYNAEPFKGRRRSFINFKIPLLYRDAFSTSVYRMVYTEDPAAESYCVDLIVPESEKDRLEKQLRDSLNAYFGWSVTRAPREMEVWVLSAKPEGITLPTAAEPAAYTAGGDHFTSEGATIAQFADYLESFGIAGMPVVDETHSDQLYRIDFSFEPENPNSFFEALGHMGLKVKKEKRVIKLLVLE